MNAKVGAPLVIALLAVVLALPSAAVAPEEVYWFNGPVAWPMHWIPIPSLNDPADPVSPEVDFVGDAADPGGYYAVDDQYVYFRVRVNVGGVQPPDFDLRLASDSPPASWYTWTFRDNILIAISNDGPDAEPDWGFAWDTHPWPYYHHALELRYLNPDALDPTRQWTQLDDIDHSEPLKLPPRPSQSRNDND